MSTTVHKTSKSNQQSLFFRDLASPISTHRGSAGGGSGRFATPGQAAAVSALWRENFNSSDPPPPPMFTLEDRADFSPEPGLGELPASPELCSDPKTPTPTRGYFSSPSPLKTRAEASGSGVRNAGFGVSQQQQVQQTPGSSSWWSPARSEEKGKGSPVDGVVQSQALIMLPPPREVVRPEVKRDNLPVGGGLDEEEWVTVYGFSPGDTNLVLREFEKCGVILKHVPGPRDANWMHILYQNRYDARKALAKNGTQLNGVLIIGVKLVDPVQLQYLNEKLDSSTHGGFMVSLPPQSKAGRSAALSPLAASQRPNHLQNGSSISSDSGRRSTGAIASPAKSVVSKVMDLMFGL